MATDVNESAHGTNEDHQARDEEAQGQEVQATTQANPQGHEQQLSQGLSEQITQAVEPALTELQQRMAGASREDGEQTGVRRNEEREPTQLVHEQSIQSIDQERQAPRGKKTHSEASRSEHDGQGGNKMATEANQTSQAQDQEANEQDNRETGQPERQASEQARADQRGNRSSSKGNHGRQAASAGGQTPAEEASAAARVGLLNTARKWRDTGSTYQALQAYEEILRLYPGSGVASAATEELVEMARRMEEQGRFHAALDVFKLLEQYGVAK